MSFASLHFEQTIKNFSELLMWVEYLELSNAFSFPRIHLQIAILQTEVPFKKFSSQMG